MALNLRDKEVIVDRVSAIANNAVSLVVADYSGSTVPAMTSLRAKARESGVHVSVIRCTLARRALKGTSFECMSDALVGPLIFGFAENDPGAGARLFKDFAKLNAKFEVKALSLSGQFYDASQLDAIASLPTKHEALTKLAVVLMAPATKLVRTIAEPHSQIVRALDDYRRQKENS